MSDHSRLTTGVVIATRNRAGQLAHTLDDLTRQSLLPDHVLIVDASDDGSQTGVEMLVCRPWPFRTSYLRARAPSAARQRNQGAAAAHADLVVFLDDDVHLDSRFLEELVAPFENDPGELLGGVSGTITNQAYTPLTWPNRLLLDLCIGPLPKHLGGRLVGPAVNFLPEDRPDTVQEVDWLPSTCTAYRREVFLKYGFPEHFEGYSFAEDVYLSARVAKTHRLLNTTRARLYHHDLGRKTHRDWRELGESMVRHRHEIMTEILGRRSPRDYGQLFAYEIVYCTLAWLAGVRPIRPKRLLALTEGKLRAFFALWRQTRRRTS
jgi:GT2 family glycosyltransferase